MPDTKSSKEIKRQVRDLKALLDVSKAISNEAHLDDLLQVIMDKTTEVIDADRSSLFLYDESTGELWSKIAQKLGKIKEIRFAVGVGIAGEVAKTRNGINIKDAYNDPRFNPEFDKQTGYHTRSILCIPIISINGNLVGVIQVLNKKGGRVFDKRDESLLEALVSHAAVALERAKLTEAYVEKQRIEEALKLARDIQMSILPKRFPPFPDRNEFEIFATIEPAKEVGGDFYDFFFIDQQNLYFCIGDVSGKGIPASLFMAVTKTLIKAKTTKGMFPDEILTNVNKELCVDNDTAMFVTIFCGILNTSTGEVFYSNGGHNHPYILSQDHGTKPLNNKSGMALGVNQAAKYSTSAVTLAPGDSIFLYTDGVTEAMDIHGNFYTDERLIRLLGNQKHLPIEDRLRTTLNDLKNFSSGAPPADDITLLGIQYQKT
ncbi:MAG TPA: GAF domain-containing SpoIIE family protein phosphatase [Thermodesulfobacteriota bacterium]